jgi:GrpB-like predicted nucleotidyltransferase (UPF0157 family)
MADDLSKLSTAELGRLFPIILSEYNPVWKEMYASEKRCIMAAVNHSCILSIEHIGSTAVPDLTAKPTIDILIQIEDNCNLNALRHDLKKTGYDFIPKPENPPPHMMFAKGYTKNGISGQTFHVHIRYKGDWDELIFRDFLLSESKIAKEYADLKSELAKKFQHDREKYTENKGDFIRKIVQRARRK